MEKRLLLLILTLVFISSIINSQIDMISLEEIENMYSRMHSNGIDTNKEMLYGYFFTNKEPSKLEELAKELRENNYKFVSIHQDEDLLYWLHLERVEIHNAKSLFDLNKLLYKIADKYGVNSYDGFDVGNKDSSKPIERDTYAVPEEFKANDYLKEGFLNLLIVNFAFDKFPHKEEFRYLIELTIEYQINDSTELPSQEDLEDLDEFETFIEANLTGNKISNYYIGRTTYRGIRKSYFVVNDHNNADGFLKFVQAKSNKREFEFSIIEDNNWDNYKRLKKEIEKK